MPNQISDRILPHRHAPLTHPGTHQLIRAPHRFRAKRPRQPPRLLADSPQRFNALHDHLGKLLPRSASWLLACDLDFLWSLKFGTRGFSGTWTLGVRASHISSPDTCCRPTARPAAAHDTTRWRPRCRTEPAPDP